MASKTDAIYEDLYQKISSGVFQIGSYLPSETKLSRQYGLSRETVRKVLDQFLELGMIQKIRGKGSLVMGNQQITAEVTESTNLSKTETELFQKTKLIEFSHKIIQTKNFIDDPTEINRQYQVVDIGKVTMIKRDPAFISHDYVRLDLAPEITEEIAEGNVAQYLEEELGLKPAFGRREIVINRADIWDSQYLNLSPGESLPVITEKIYLDNARLLMCSRVRYRPDCFKYNEFVRK